MAARWSGKDGDLNAGNSDLLASNTPSELVPSRRDVEGVAMDPQSCMDHSILAIFEDSTVASEDKSGVEEESETLLSALTEMLDSVEDDDGTPFDTLPDTKLLTHPERRDDSVEPSLADKLRPRSKSPNVTFTIKIEGEKEDESKIERSSPPQLFRQQSSTLFHSKNKKAKAEVEVFTSTSLVNLVKIMHPYCLKLHVEEEGDKLRRKHNLFSQEEVWKYERPTEECDEEINVVSDDEVAVKETKEGDEKSDDGKLLKGVLLNGNSSRAPSSREKKRVRFGHVQVASIDESVEKGLNEKNLTSGHTRETVSAPPNSAKALEIPAGSAPEPVPGYDIEVLPPKGETKAKSLSLQQYRQLRQKRQPLVEKQRNYTTKWPSVSEPPKELTPILCLQGQRQNSCGPKTAHHYPDGQRSGADPLHRSHTAGYKTHRTCAPPRPHPSETKSSTPLCRSTLKCPRTESKIISHASPPPDVTTNTRVTVPESKISPVKKPTLLSSDPPNPVLLPLPVSQTASPCSDHSSSESKVEFLSRDSNLDSTRHFQEIHNESSGTSLQQQQSSIGPKPKVMLLNQDCTTLFQEIKNKFTEIASGLSSRSPALCKTTTESSSGSKKLQPQKCSPNHTKETKLEPETPLSPSPDTVSQIKCPSLAPYCSQPPSHSLPEVLPSKSPPKEPSPALQFVCRVQSATADSGIEAPDLTSLLEQFEETQAKEERVCEPKLVSPTSNLPTDGHLDLDRTQPVGRERGCRSVLTPPVEPLKPLSTSESPGTPKTLRNLPHLQMSEGVDIPEPLGTDIILSTQQDLPARRKNPPSKAIQIIDPRPLPSKKTHTNLSEFPAAHTSAHMYSTVSSDHDYCGPVDRSLTSATQRSRASKLKDISKSTDELQVTAHDSSAAAECNKQTSTGEVTTTVSNSAKSVMQCLSEQPRSETNPSTDKVLSLSDSAAKEQDQTAPCTLPTPPPSPPVRGREKRRYRRRSPRSDSSCSSCSSSSSSSSSSASPSPKRQKHRHKRSESSSCSSSSSRSISRSPPRRYRWSYSRSRCSRSRSRSWTQSRSPSRSRSPSPRNCHRQWRDVYSSRESRKLRREHEMRIQKLKAIEERRVVYVGRICRSMTHDELRERFTQSFKPQPGHFERNISLNVYKVTGQFPWSSLRETDRGISAEISFPVWKTSQTLKWEGVWRELGCLARTASFAVREESGHSLKSSLSHAMVIDTRNSSILPRKGGLLKIHQELAGYTGGDASFLKEDFEIQLNKTLFWDSVLSASLWGGLLLPIGDKPTSIADRFYLGGPTSIRGFSMYSMGPQSEGDYLGGEGYWAGGLHLYTPLPFRPGKGGFGDLFRTHFFLNAGNLCNLNYGEGPQAHLKKLAECIRWSYGLGIVLRLGNIARLELNYCIPMGVQSGDRICDGVQFGAGIRFL